jgi:hypothetical protein
MSHNEELVCDQLVAEVSAWLEHNAVDVMESVHRANEAVDSIADAIRVDVTALTEPVSF